MTNLLHALSGSWLSTAVATVFVVLFTQPTHATERVDPYLWLEEIDGSRAKAWVEEQNSKTVARLSADSRFHSLKQQYLDILTNKDRVPEYGSLKQDHGVVFRIEQTRDHPRGLLQRVPVNAYGAGAPWETLLDIDALAAEEGRNWYVSLVNFRVSPSGSRALIGLSDGGADAVSVREYDLKSKSFIEDGFITPTARQIPVWVDDNRLLIAIALNSDEKTASNYPRLIRFWRRGEVLQDAPVIKSMTASKMLLAPVAFETASSRRLLVIEAASFSDISVYALDNEFAMIPVSLPVNINDPFRGLSGIGDTLVLTLPADWTVGDKTFVAGDLVGVDMAQMIAQKGDADGAVTLLYRLSQGAIGGALFSRGAIYLTLLEDVNSRLVRLTKRRDGGWRVKKLKLPFDGYLGFPAQSDVHSDEALIRLENFLIPPIVYCLNARGRMAKVQRQAATADLSAFVTEKFFARAKDGERIPYFVTRTKEFAFDDSAPVLMTGYGGFGLSMTQLHELPYIGPMHELWLKSGGIFVLANPRGGGEYGPRWHNAAKRQNRQIVYDDLYAVANDLILRGVTKPSKLGFVGGSNGGLAAAVVATQRPDLFAATIPLVPLLDMARYHKLLAGASWMDEYGDPGDPIEGPPLLAYSTYQNLSADGHYPEIFFMTSTRDDRVHPGHARKMAAKMKDMGHPVLFFEAPEGGHAMAVNDEGRAFNYAMETIYFLQKLVDDK